MTPYRAVVEKLGIFLGISKEGNALFYIFSMVAPPLQVVVGHQEIKNCCLISSRKSSN